MRFVSFKKYLFATSVLVYAGAAHAQGPVNLNYDQAQSLRYHQDLNQEKRVLQSDQNRAAGYRGQELQDRSIAKSDYNQALSDRTRLEQDMKSHNTAAAARDRALLDQDVKTLHKEQDAMRKQDQDYRNVEKHVTSDQKQAAYDQRGYNGERAKLHHDFRETHHSHKM